jgi:hypothetical protein
MEVPMSAIRMVLGTAAVLSAMLPACSSSSGPNAASESAGAGASGASGDPAGAGGSGTGSGTGSGATATCTDIMNPDSGLLDPGPEALPDDLGPAADAVAGQSVKSGAWSDPATWLDGTVPESGTRAIVSTGHTVDIDVDTSVAGVLVQEGALLRFGHEATATLESSENVVVEGTLEMRPSSASFDHTVRFVGVDESAMVGGGTDVLPDDTGLWVMGVGKLSIRGASKTPWTRLQGSASPGETVITLQAAPVGWEVGDEIVVVPTETPGDDANWNDATNQIDDPFHAKFERRFVTAVDGASVVLDAPLEHAHDEVVAGDGVKSWTAEVANLSRNTHVEGTPGGRAHVFIRSMTPQAVAYLEGRFLGPRQVRAGHDRPQLVLGRYAMHFHHCMEGSRGSWVHGTAFHDIGNRVYVPHMSNGVTMRNNVSFHSQEAAFWWDFQEISHDILYENNLLALVSMNGVDSAQTGMMLNMGDGNVARDNVAVYASGGDFHSRGAFEWNTDSEGIWTFENNLAHSSAAGVFVWQNTSFNHVISNFESYNNRLGIMHGAYGNSYTYRHGYHYNSPVQVEATSGNSNGVVFDSITFDAAGADYAILFHDSPLPSGQTNKWLRCDFRGYTKAALRLYSAMPDWNEEKKFKYGDFIACIFEGEAFVLDQSGAPAPGVPETFPLLDGNRIRVQPAEGQPYQAEIVDGAPVLSDIELFAPYFWGSGDGLLGEYYVGSNFEEPAFTRVDSVIMFQQWSKDPRMSPFGVHHLVPGDAYSIRWTGEVEPQHSGQHTFSVQGSGGTRLWIDGVQIIDSWADKSDNEVVVTSTPVELVQGKKVAIQLEHSNEGGARACMLYWTPPQGSAVFLPQTQTYSGVEIAECAQ